MKNCIYINGRFYKYHVIYHEMPGHGECEVSFLIDKKNIDNFPIKVDNLVYQYGIHIQTDKEKENEMYWYLIDSSDIHLNMEVYARPNYFELIVFGKRKKIDEKIVLRDIKINDLV